MLLLPPLGFVFFSFCSSVTLHASLNNNINQKPKTKKHLIAATPTFSLQTIEIGSFSFFVPPFAHPSFVFFCSLGRLSIRPSAFLPLTLNLVLCCCCRCSSGPMVMGHGPRSIALCFLGIQFVQLTCLPLGDRPRIIYKGLLDPKCPDLFLFLFSSRSLSFLLWWLFLCS